MIRVPARLFPLCALVVGCGGDALPPLGEPAADVRVEVASRSVPEGEPIRVRVTVREAGGATVEVGPPAAEGLVARLSEEHEEPVEGGTLTVRAWELAGSNGSYVIQVPEATARYPDGREVPIASPPLFVDLGVQGPTSDLKDLLRPDPPPPARWPWVAGIGAALLALAGLGFWFWRRRRRAGPPAAPPEPPDVVALRAWAGTLDDPSLDDHARALACSAVFRDYLEAVHGWPASARTTGEIVEALYADGRVSAPLLDGARRVLHATDLLKFARQGGGAAFFASLDADFRAYVLATRPPVAEGAGRD